MEDGSYMRNPKNDIIEFYNIHVQKRTIERLVIGQDGNYYIDKDFELEFSSFLSCTYAVKVNITLIPIK